MPSKEDDARVMRILTQCLRDLRVSAKQRVAGNEWHGMFASRKRNR